MTKEPTPSPPEPGSGDDAADQGPAAAEHHPHLSGIYGSNIYIGNKNVTGHASSQSVSGDSQPTQPDAKAGSNPARRRWGYFSTGIVGAATVLGALVAIATFLLTMLPDTTRGETGSNSDRSNEPPRTTAPAPTISGTPVDAKIADTWEVATNYYVGVKVYSDPTETGKGTEVAHHPEGAPVQVFCRLQEGRTIEDSPWRDRPTSTNTWYLISERKGHWVPDMYVELLEGSPEDLPDCSY